MHGGVQPRYRHPRPRSSPPPPRQAMTALRVLVADDHPVVRDGLRAMLASAGVAEVVCAAATGDQAVRQAAVCHPDVVVMALAMPGLDVVEATPQNMQANPQVGVLVLTVNGNDDALFASMQA